MTSASADLATPSRRSRRGFAGMDPQRVREIAGMGGRAAHAQGLAHEFSPQEARLAGMRSQQLRTLRQAQDDEEARAAHPPGPGAKG